MSKGRYAAGYGLAVLLLCAISPVQAQQEAPLEATTAVALEQYNPVVSTGVLGTYGAHTLRAWNITSGAHVHYSKGALRLVSNRGETYELVSTRLGTEITSAVGLFDVADLGVGVRAVPFQEGLGLSALDERRSPLSSAALGDLRVVARGRVLGGVDTPFALALVVPIDVPIGDDESFNSDGDLRVGGLLAAGYRSDAIHWMANVGYEMREQRTVFDYTSDDVLKWSIATELPAAAWDGRVALVGTAFGSVPIGQPGQRVPLELLAGARLRLTDNVQTSLAGGAGIGRAVGTPEYRFLFQINWLPAPLPPEPPPVPLTLDDTEVGDANTETESQNELIEVAEEVTPPPPAVGTLKGLVKDTDSGEPLAQATVRAGDTTIQTDTYGRFELEAPLGEVTVQVSLDGYGPTNRTVALGETPLDLVLGVRMARSGDARGTIQGDVRARTGSTLHATLAIRSDSGEMRMVKTDEQGRFETQLPPGRYTLEVDSPGYARKVQRTEVRGGELTIYNFLLAPR